MSVPRMGVRLAGVLVAAHVLIGAGVARAYFAGGGKDAAKGNDCLIGYDFVDPDQVTQDGKKYLFVCMDCDPSCDLDGVPTANGSCTMAAGACINQSGVENCTPAAGLDKASAKGKVKGVKGASGKLAIDVPQLLEGSACGAMVDVFIPVKVTKKGAKDGKATLKLSASVKKNKAEGLKGRKDKDKLTYVCQPRPEGQACPISTTTTTSGTTTTTSTTLEPTSTTIVSTTSTTLVSTTSTTVASTTSTTVLSTTSSTLATTTSTTLVSTTSTTEVTTTSTTTTTAELCGNGVIDPGEECDGTDLGGATCVSSPSAALLCTPECTLDYSQCPGDTTTSTTTPSSTTSTLAPTTTSTTEPPASTTSTTMETSTTSTSEPPTTSTSTTLVVTTTTTSTSLPTGTVLAFTTGEPTGACGAVKSGGANGTTRKVLGCGGLNVGGGNSTVAEGPTPAGATTLINVAGGPPSFTMSGRTAAQTGSNRNCSDTGCIFGPYLPIANSGTSTCVQNTFASPATGTLDVTTGVVNGGFPLTSTVYLTANASDPCPRCVGGTPGVTDSGTCQIGWTSGVGPSPTEGNACTPTDAAGDNYDCAPPPGSVLPSFPVDLTPITTGASSKSDPGGIFCPGQGGGASAGAFGCNGDGSPSAICPGDAPGAPDYIEEVGSPAGFLSAGTHDVTLASTFCIPSVGGSLGFLINGAANLPGPGATSLPGTLELLP